MRLLAAAMTGLLVAGCAGLLPQPTGDPDGPGISISNETKLDVTLAVNGIVVRHVPPGIAIDVSPAELPPLPWSVEALSPSGRLIVGMTVNAGDVSVSGNEQRGTGARADLSCGRLDVWSGPPMMGPVPGPGVPGDCLP